MYSGLLKLHGTICMVLCIRTMHVQCSTETRKMGGCGHVIKDSK